ncbi:NUDIX domain-containing protein [Streptomyces torulosus]|uniref:NUDIX domain-containing protein n=1 Tax=Streptomyces torulosus TaxID=68276 RepID=UPI0012FED5A5|nr:NUDIX domain-containing protein [Streptomyces torulosus]
MGENHSRGLLIERRCEPSTDCWALPGGHMDPGEGPRETAASRAGGATRRMRGGPRRVRGPRR